MKVRGGSWICRQGRAGVWAISLPLMLLLAGCDKPIITIDLKGQPSIPAQPSPPRFQLVVHPEFPGKFTYLVDTQTGAIWSPVTYTNLEGAPSVWVQEKFVKSVSSSAQSPLSLDALAILHPATTTAEEKK